MDSQSSVNLQYADSPYSLSHSAYHNRKVGEGKITLPPHQGAVHGRSQPVPARIGLEAARTGGWEEATEAPALVLRMFNDAEGIRTKPIGYRPASCSQLTMPRGAKVRALEGGIYH